MTTQETAVAVFDPTAAGKKLRREVEDRRPQLAALLGVDQDDARGKAMLDRFVTVALHAATSNRDLLECTPESLVESIRQSAILGLEPTGALGEGAIVRYNVSHEEEREVGSGNKRRTITVKVSVPTAQFQPMYRGLMKLARRSSQVRAIDANVVYEGDLFEIEQGTEPRIRHVPWPMSGEADRGSPRGAYAFARMTNDELLVEWMTYADIEAVRKSSRASANGPWVSFWAEMARKSVIRRLMKRLPLESLAEHALRIETEAESLTAIPEVASRASVASAAPLARLHARLGVGGDEDPVDPPATPPDRPGDQPDQAEDVEEGVVRDAPADRPRCGKPGMAEGVSCVLDPGHAGNHAGDGGETWL